MIDAFLALHVGAGFTALAAAAVAMATRKGGSAHRLAGRVYVAGMLAVTLTTFALVAARPNAFLLAIAIFSFYLVFTGWRAGLLRDGRPRLADRLASATMALTGLVMLAMGAAGLVGAGGAQPVILLVFGSIGLTLAISDLRLPRNGPSAGTERIARHLTRMLAGTTATITAAVVVNLGFLPDIVAWLGPTALVVPVIIWWNARILRGSPDNPQTDQRRST